MDNTNDQRQDDVERDESRLRNEPVQSDRVVEEPGLFPPKIDADRSIDGSPEELGVLQDEQSR